MKATWQTSFGLTQRHCFIFSAVSDSPQREAFFSGRFVNGQCRSSQRLKSWENISSRIRGTKPFFTFATKMSCLFFVNAHEQRIEPVRTGNVTANDELLLSVRAVLDPRA